MEQKPPEYQGPPPYCPYEAEDEINLLDLFIVLLKHKWLIIGMVFLAGLVAIFLSLWMTKIYRSEATIVPRPEEKTDTSPAISLLKGLGGMAEELAGLGGGGTADKFEVVLKSRYLARRIMERNGLMSRLFEEDWDPEKKAWIVIPGPTFQDAYEDLADILTIERDHESGVLTIKFDHKNPHFAKEMVDHYLTELSESLREQTLSDAEENQRFLRKQLQHTSDSLMKEKIYTMLAREIEKETFARAQKYYSFLVLDPPIVPDLDKEIKPRRALICVLSITAAFFVAVCLAFFLEYIHNIRTREDPDRLQRKNKNNTKLKSK
jgi:uncharacterized protein involved in exopolysaccharide biosynthesis